MNQIKEKEPIQMIGQLKNRSNCHAFLIPTNNYQENIDEMHAKTKKLLTIHDGDIRNQLKKIFRTWVHGHSGKIIDTNDLLIQLPIVNKDKKEIRQYYLRAANIHNKEEIVQDEKKD